MMRIMMMIMIVIPLIIKIDLKQCIDIFSEHFHIFVGDLSPDIETHQLKGAFQVFGEIS
jgi:hypothetical protein